MQEHTPVFINRRNSMAALRPVFFSLFHFFHYKNVRRSLNLLGVFVLLSLVVSNARGAGYSMVLISHTPGGADSAGISDYVSVAYGNDTMEAPYPVMVFSSLSTDLVDTSGENPGVIEGNGSGNQQEYDVFMYDEVNNRMELLSRSRGSGQDGESVLASIGANDPNLVVFQSSATNLRSTPDTNGKTDIYMVDLNNLDADPVLVSVNADGAEDVNGHSGNTYYKIEENNLDEKKITETGQTWYQDPDGTWQQISDWHKPAVVYTTDLGMRKTVVFESRATNLVKNLTTSGKQIFRRVGVDDPLVSTELLSKNKLGVEGNGDSWQPYVSTVDNAEGRYVVFVSDATNLTDGSINALDDNNNSPDIFLLDTVTHEITLISRQWNCNGDDECTPGPVGNGSSTFPSFSKDGRYIVFQSEAYNLVPGQVPEDPNGFTNGFSQIYLYDTQEPTMRLRMVSVSSYLKGIELGEQDQPSVQGDLPSVTPVVVSSARGAQVVAFTSYATNLVVGDTNENCMYSFQNKRTSEPVLNKTNCPDVFVHDFNKQQTWRVSFTADGQESMASSNWPTLSGNGRFVYFSSSARLLGGGEETRGQRQIFRRDQGNPPGNPNLQPISWTFKEVNLSQVTQDYVPQTRTFRIAALADITVKSMQMENGVNFKILDDDVNKNTCFPGKIPFLLKISEECTFKVEFIPTQTGTVSDKVQIDLHDTNLGMHDRTIEARVTGNATSMFYLPLVFFNSKP
jgi:hypothetical protein